MAIHSTMHPRSGNMRRSRGRCSNSGGHRRDYSTRNLNSVQEIGQMQHSPSHGIDPQMMPNSPSYGGGAAGGGYFMHSQFPGAIFANQLPMGHHSAAAQHAAGTPLYINNHVMYPYYQHGGLLYPTMVQQPDYSMIDEKGEEQIGPENTSGVISPNMWPVPIEYQQHIESQLPLPSEEFIQPQQPDEYGVQTADEYILQSSNEFTQSPQHQLQQNEFIGQQASPEFNPQNTLPEANEFLHPSDGQGFVYGQPEPIEHNSPILLNPIYKSNFPIEYVPANPQQQPHHHAVEFLQPEHNDSGHHQNDEILSFDAYNNNINVDKNDQYENQLTEISPPDPINYKESVATFARSHDSPIQFLQSSDRIMQTVPNIIEITNQQLQQQLPSQQIQQQSPHQQLLPQQQHFAEENIENVLIHQTNEKLSVHVEKPQETQTSQNAWANRKTTQSVAISAIPSNNYAHLEQVAVPSDDCAGSEPDNGLNNNKLALENNNSSFVNSSKPTVPKVDERSSTNVPSTKAAAETKSQTAQVTRQSMEIQTVPVEMHQRFNQADFAPLGTKVKENVATSTADKLVENTTWASLFNKVGGSSTPNNRQSEAQKRPVAMVSPYCPKDTANDAAKNGTTLAPVSVPQGSNVISNLSYSAASTQNLPNASAQSLAINTNKKVPPAKATINPTTKPVPVQPSASETSMRLGGIFN